MSIATVIGKAALKEGLYMKQAEVHGMSQRTAKGRQQGCRPILWSVHGSASLLSGLSYHSSGRTRKYFAFCRVKCCPTN